MAFQFAFAGDGFQDEGEFLAAFEHHAISIGKMQDFEKLPLLVPTFIDEQGIGMSPCYETNN